MGNEARSFPDWDIIVIGAGAAGYFGAITAVESQPGMRVLMLERGREVLQKVRISGGGRCNVTHACYEADELVRHYPRGEKELRSPFRQFGPANTVAWFRQRGVRLKTEADGRMFPVTDQAETIASCLEAAAREGGVTLRTSQRVESLRAPSEKYPYWGVHCGGAWLSAGQVLVATGSSTAVWQVLASLGLQLVPPVPSLFTFHVRDSRIQGLAGVSLAQARLELLGGGKLATDGPLLVTHWGLSGPAVLRFSAWGARLLAERGYAFRLSINWTGRDVADWSVLLDGLRRDHPRKRIGQTPVAGIPARLWERLCQAAGIPADRSWAELRREEAAALRNQCSRAEMQVTGKSTFKEEFVTAGGVALKELDFRRFEARRFPGLYLAGEVLDIDAITGGFNFQAAWTGGYLAGKAMAARWIASRTSPE